MYCAVISYGAERGQERTKQKKIILTSEKGTKDEESSEHSYVCMHVCMYEWINSVSIKSYIEIVVFIACIYLLHLFLD